MKHASVFCFTAASAAAVLLADTVPADAGTIVRTVAHGKPMPVVPLFGLARETCGVYPLHDVRIERQPQHGAARIAKVSVKLPASFGVCAGTNVTAPWVIYQPAGNYAGGDSFGVSWRIAPNVLEYTSRYESYEVDLTVK
ncbi:hypothetical protein [Labrys neptuniae]